MNQRIVAINLGNFGSTGTIMSQIAVLSEENGFEYWCAFPESSLNKQSTTKNYIIQKEKWWRLESKLSHFLSLNDLLSLAPTRRLIHFLKEKKPDIIHLHNIHNCFLNFPMLFSFLSKRNIRIVWTLHDCWSFTGRCPYFTMANCEKWKDNCSKCIYGKHEYPKTLFHNEKFALKLKKKYFSLPKEMTIVTPSLWLSKLVEQSFLGKYHVRVINNGVDLSIFRPLNDVLRTRFKIQKSKYILLGVAFDWGKRKGIDAFVRLSHELDSDLFQIVLVGINDSLANSLPSNILSIHRTKDKTELAHIYSSADLFVNPTLEDNFPTVNMESLACGTPVLTYRTGGSHEIIDETCGSAVDYNDFASLKREIIRICSTKPYSKEACLNRAKLFDTKNKTLEYINLYKEIL